MRKRAFRTPYVDCRNCGSAGQVCRVRVTHTRARGGLIQWVESGECSSCAGSGRRVKGLAGYLLELAYAAAYPLLNVRRFRSARQLAKQQIAAVSADFHESM